MASFDIFKGITEKYSKSTTIFGILLITVLSLLWLSFKKKNRYNNLPPLVAGSLPILGHMHLLTENVHLKVNEWQKKYGPIFRLNFGNKTAVILGVYNDIKEIYKMEGMTNRHPEMFKFSSEFRSLLELNGKEWVDHRKLTSTALRVSERDHPNEKSIQEEIENLLKSLESGNLSEDIEIRSLVGNATNNVIFQLICGKRFDKNDPIMMFMNDYRNSVHDYLQIQGLVATIGIPRAVLKIFSSKYREGINSLKRMDEFIKSEIESHEKLLDPENAHDFIDFCLIDIQKDSSKTNKALIRGDAQTLLLAATESVSMTIEWIFLFAAKHQNLQEKCYREIIETIGNRKPIWQDHNSLPYTEAFTMECQRITSMVPVNLARCAPHDIVFNGYDIPEGSLIMANFLAVDKDPNLWTNPEEFDPTRFSSNDEQRIMIPEFFIPFSLGSRKCLGNKLAKMEIFLIFTSMIQKYRIIPSSEGVSFESSFRLTHMLLKSNIRLEKRNIINSPKD